MPHVGMVTSFNIWAGKKRILVWHSPKMGRLTLIKHILEKTRVWNGRQKVVSPFQTAGMSMSRSRSVKKVVPLFERWCAPNISMRSISISIRQQQKKVVPPFERWCISISISIGRSMSIQKYTDGSKRRLSHHLRGGVPHARAPPKHLSYSDSCFLPTSLFSFYSFNSFL